MLNAVHHNNVVIFDDRGIPSIMCRYMRPQDAEETPAMFKIGDKVADAIYISKYPNVVINGRAYSLPMVDPTVCITFDEAVQACRAKGEGWHLMTAVEWEYLLIRAEKKAYCHTVTQVAERIITTRTKRESVRIADMVAP